MNNNCLASHQISRQQSHFLNCLILLLSLNKDPKKFHTLHLCRHGRIIRHSWPCKKWIIKPDAKSQLIRKDPDARKIEGRRRRGQQRLRWLDGITDSKEMSLSQLQEMGRTGKPGVLWFMGLQGVGHDSVTEQQQKEQVYELVFDDSDAPFQYPGGHLFMQSFHRYFLLCDRYQSRLN